MNDAWAGSGWQPAVPGGPRPGTGWWVGFYGLDARATG